MVAPLDKIEGALESNDLKVIRSKKVELLQGDFVFPLALGLEALGNQKPPQLDDQNANVRPAGTEIVEADELAEYAPSDIEDEAVESNPGPLGPSPPEAPGPSKGWDPFKMPDGSPVPKGYNYDGTRLVRNKRGSKRPLDTPSSAWMAMSQKDRAADAERYRKKMEAEAEAKYQELKKSVPAMPVIQGRIECHRERYAHLCVDKLGDIADSMYALVAKILQQPEIQRTPAAKAALDKEWQKLVDKGCWIEKQVREYDQVASEAQKKKLKVHFGRVFEICTLKGSELKEGDPNRKYKGRSVFQGNKVLDENSDHALFAELGSSPASMEAGKIIDVYGSQPGFTKQQADARQAYTQALFKGTETWVRLPRNRWPKSWSGMKDPVAPLRLALYGHPDSGGIWEQHCTKELTKAGFVAVLPDIWPSVFHHPKLDLLLVIYVDDFKMAGPEKNMDKGWKLLGDFIDMDPAEVLGRYFGCMHHDETQIKLPPSAHPFHEVFEKGNKTAAASVRHEDYWDIDPENMLAVKRHNYPRKRLYVPTQDDVSMFPTMTTSRCTVALNQGGKEETIIQDDYNERLSPSLPDWWVGETYFDLQGRDPGELKVAVAAARKGKPIRDKSQAKKEVKSNRFVTIGDDQKNMRVGCVTKPVNRVTYDMADFLESCVTRYCELAKVTRDSLKPVVTPFHDQRTARPLEENEKVGRLQPIASKVLMKILFAARMARWDLLRATQSLASRVTKWSCDCDIGLHRLVAYINSTLHITMSGFIGDSINDCQLWLFCDSDFAGEFDAKSTTGCALFLVGPNTYYPLNAFSKKQTSITMSSTESEVVAANQGIRAQGLPSLSLWFFLWMGEAGREAVPKAAIQPGTAVARIDPELDEIRYGGKTSDGRSVADINGLHVSLPAKFKVRVMEDNQATITILLTGSSNTMRHTERTQKVSFAWLRQQFEFGNFLMLNADTREQVADIFTKPFTDRPKWQHALRLIAHTDAFHTSKVARGNPKPTQSLATPAKETPESEELAKSLLKSKEFTYDAVEKLLQSMFKEGKSTFRAMQQRTKRSKHLVFGAFAHGPFCGITNRTALYPNCVKYINQFLGKQLPKTMTWSTFAISHQVRAAPHMDVRNLAGSSNCAFSLGQTKGGGLYVEDEGGDRTIKTKQGEDVKVKLYNTCRKPICFSPKQYHAVQSWTGVRLSVACYTTRSVFDLKQAEQRTLQQYCFRLPKLRASACCTMPSPRKEGGSALEPITKSLLRKGIHTQEQEGVARLSSCPVHPKPPRAMLCAAPASIDLHRCATRADQVPVVIPNPIVPIMANAADIQVQTEYLSVDARVKPLKLVRDKLALELLYHGGLAAERLGIEGDEFYEGIRKLYSQLPVQSMASSSFKDSIVPCPNLIALSELSDIGLGHLKNHLALRKEKALVLVTDSTSALIYKDHGQIYKGDMVTEVELAAQTNGYRVFRYSMLWGKTLTHLAQEARKLVGEITAAHPECEVDVVCWWLGNEVCGDYGCLPPLEAMGTAWRPSTLNSVEHVTGRIRNGIDILATLAGMPQVAAVHIHSNPDAFIYNLHPEYNVVMTQALNEAEMKGLVTVCINSLAENLVFQDGYHARDTHENRARMSRYLVSTLLLLDREVVAKRLRPGVDALVHAFRHDDASFKHTPESERICQEMTASIKRIQDEEEVRIQARIAARSSGQPVASSDLKWERADRNIPTAHWKLEERRAEIERDMRRDLADGDLDLEAPFVIPDNDLVAVEHNEEATFVNPNETVDEALDVIEALHEVEPESEPAVSSPRGDASRSIENTGLMEDIYLQEMYGTSPAEDEVTLKAAKETFKFEGSDYVLHEMTQDSLNKPGKRLWFHHGDLVFFTGLVRGNFTRDFPEVKHDQGLWTSIDKCLAAFNRSRKRHWGIRQVIQMVAEDKKGRLELKGIDITRKEGLNQQYFPVLIRAVQGHNKAIAHNPDTDFALATSYYSTLEKTEANLVATREGVPVLCLEDVPKILYHRTTRDSFQGILQGGLVAGSQGSGKIHNYFATCPVTSNDYRSGVRANAPIEIKWDTEKLLRSGCLLFTTRSDGVLCREDCSPAAIIAVTDTHREEILYALRLDDIPEAPRGSTEAEPTSRKRQLPARESLSSEDVVMPADDDEYVEVEIEPEMGEEIPQPATPPATHTTLEAVAENRPEVPNPFMMQGPATFPCPQCQAECFVGQHHCLRCRHQLAEIRGEDRRFIKTAQRRNRILDQLSSAGVTVQSISAYELGKLAKHTKEEERGQMSYEAHTIRNAKDKVQRAFKVKGTNYRSLADRFDKDPTFAARQAERGLTRTDMRRLEIYAKGYLPAPGRTRQQVVLGAGSQVSFSAAKTEVVAKIVIFEGVPVAELQALGLADQHTEVNMAMGWHGTFMDVETFAGLALGNEDARKVVTFNGLVTLRATTLGEMKEEIYALLTSNYEPALSKIRADQPARAKQSAISKAKAKAGPPPSTTRQSYSTEDWNRWHYGGCHGRTWYSAAEWRRYWGN